ncbi:MAG: MarR family transcriptional regulator [Treponema sp.]|nr:MarR family transcriptional regulator [Treponema sp.]
MKEEVKNSISKVSHIHSLTADFLIKKLNDEGFKKIASSHGNILYQLASVPKMKMNELSKKINRDKSTTTVLVRKLFSDGLVCFETDETDRRNKFIMLTEEGRDYTSRMHSISKELFQTFYEGFSEEEKNQFVSYLNRIEKNFTI